MTESWREGNSILVLTQKVLFTMFFSLFYWVLSSNSIPQILAIFGIYFAETTNYLQIVVLLLLLLWWLSQRRIKINLFMISALFVLVLCCFLSVNNSPNSSGFVSSLSSLFNRFFSIIVFLLMMAVSPEENGWYKDKMIALFLRFSFFQAVLGIFQFITRSVIFPTQIDGVNLVVSPYYLTGDSAGGTGDISKLVNHSYLVRATGLTGAGLYLGIVLLVALALSHTIRSRSQRIMCYTIFCASIILTVTVTVWVGLMLYLAFLIFFRVRKPSKAWLRLSFGLNLIWPVLATVFTTLTTRFGTLSSRFRGLEFYLTNMQKDPTSLLFGQNFITYWVAKATTGFTLTMDNTFYSWILNIGIIGALICAYVVGSSYFRAIKASDVSTRDHMAALLLSLVFIANANDFTRFLGLPLIIVIFFSRSEKKYMFPPVSVPGTRSI